MMYCDKCGTPLKPGAKFCSKCGDPITEADFRTEQTPEAFCDKCGTPLKPGARFCSKCGDPITEADFGTAKAPGGRCGKCGAPLKPGARFCSKCGAALSEAEPEMSEKTEEDQGFRAEDALRVAEKAAHYIARAVEVSASPTAGEAPMDADRIQQAAIAAAVRAMRGGS